ncbi:MAG: deoxyguanosinetriphosphate triphosphohydrolase [Acidimicrobiia bacterium]|nr:MAG: deoxyguanosinetriphosphate triphosphohydrolase [Acidimicrobiia bacterium]
MSDAEFILRNRVDAERLENEQLASAATRSADTGGRAIAEEPDEWRTVFERDRDRIVHSKAFRRLKHKTQVFINPEDDHFVTRLTHTLQVTQIASAIARYLSLNIALAEAISLGHDVGHSPFGHTGEEALSEFVDGNWRHSEQSVRIFEVLEPLNLTTEVLDGIRAHPWKVETPPATAEGKLVRFADRIAYLAHDALDAVRAGILTPDEFPASALEALGRPGRAWVEGMITSVVNESMRAGEIAMSEETLDVLLDVRAFMFDYVYLRGEAESQRRRAREIIRDLVGYYLASPHEIPETYRHNDASPLTQVLDYVAGMTDRYALRVHDDLFRPKLFLS